MASALTGSRLLDRARGVHRRGEPAEFPAVRHHVRPLDARDRLGRIAGDARFFRHLCAPAADLADRGRCVRGGGPARHLAPSAGGGPVVSADLRGQNAGQPHGHPHIGGGAGRFQRDRRARGGRQSAAGRHRWSPAGFRGRRREGLTCLDLRARPDAGAWRHRTARLGRAGAVPDGPAAARCGRVRHAARPTPAAARRRAPGPAQLCLHLLDRPVREPGTVGPPADQRWSQPGVGGCRGHAGLFIVPPTRFHQPHQRRRRAQGVHRRGFAAGRAARRDGRDRRGLDWGHGFGDRAGQDPALGRHRIRPPVPVADQAAPPPGRHRDGAEGHGGVHQG